MYFLPDYCPSIRIYDPFKSSFFQVFSTEALMVFFRPFKVLLILLLICVFFFIIVITLFAFCVMLSSFSTFSQKICKL